MVFPQLASGAIAQLPIQRSRSYNTLIHRAEDGSEERYQSHGNATVRWRLLFEGLSEVERESILALYAATRGKEEGFVFLDPLSNLLNKSEDWEDGDWQKAGISNLVNGIVDPLGGTGAWRMTSAAGMAKVEQQMPIPAAFFYAASCWLRTTSGGVRLSLSDGAAAQRSVEAIPDGEWRRLVVAARLESQASSVKFSLKFDGSGSVDIFGPQLEAQPGPSSYKASGKTGGIFANTHFANEVISDLQQSPTTNAIAVDLIWTPSPS